MSIDDTIRLPNDYYFKLLAAEVCSLSFGPNNSLTDTYLLPFESVNHEINWATGNQAKGNHYYLVVNWLCKVSITSVNMEFWRHVSISKCQQHIFPTVGNMHDIEYLPANSWALLIFNQYINATWNKLVFEVLISWINRLNSLNRTGDASRHDKLICALFNLVKCNRYFSNFLWFDWEIANKNNDF